MRLFLLLLFLSSYSFSYSQLFSAPKQSALVREFRKNLVPEHKLKKKNPDDIIAIYISYNDSIFPNDEILKYKNLKYLGIQNQSYWRVKKGESYYPPKVKIDTTKLAYLANLKFLKINNLDMSSAIKDIHHFKNLEYLNLDYCNLSKIPSSISSLNKLKELTFRLNHISNIDSSNLNIIDSLRFLDLSNNSFTSFPNILNDLRNIEVIHLSNIETTKEWEKSNSQPYFSPFGVSINKIDYFNEIDKLKKNLTNSNLIWLSIYVETDLDKENVKRLIGNNELKKKLGIQIKQ